MWHSRSGEWLDQSVLAPGAGAYIGYLRKHGYSSRTIEGYLHGVGHFARWLTKSQLPLIECARWVFGNDNLQAKIGQLAVENDFLCVALGRIDDASAKR